LRCPAGHENRDDAAFCLECGARLTVACASCGRELPPAARFCDGCGAPQASQPGAAVPLSQESVTPPPSTHQIATGSSFAAKAQEAGYEPPPHLAAKIMRERGTIEGERRTVTVLFVDAVGSTPAGEKLDMEELHRVVHNGTEKMIEAVNRFEGTVTQFRGDGIMAVFGAPIAHEDSARRAVAAALVMRDALREFAAEMRAKGAHGFDYRIGLNTGPVVVGSIGSDFSMDYTAIGDTVNLGARMESLAPAGSIVITEHTKRQVGAYFELRDLGALDVKGKAEPVRAYEVLRELPSRSRLDVSVARGLTPYVGRRDQLGLLRSHFDLAAAGNGQVVFVTGEPGMGKSRLLLEFRRSLGDRARWLEGRCISWGGTFPYLPIVDVVRDNFGVEEGDDDEKIIAAVDERAQAWDEAAAASAVPQLKYLLNVDPGDSSLGMDPAERRTRVLDALRALLMQESQRAPLVIAIEDLHWADEPSEDALAALVDAVASSPVLLILTYRPGYAHGLGDRTYYGRLVLMNLPPAESASMVRGVLQAAGVPDTLQQAIVAKAEGNPFFIEEVSRSLVESGALMRSGSGYRLAKPVEQVSIPDTIQEVILSRLDRLQRNAKEAVQYASVIGREFPVRLLKHIAEAEESMDALLDELKALELIYEKSYFPELEYMFKHALTQEVALSTLLADRRKSLHRAVAAAIEQLYADRLMEQHEALAYHYFEGEEWEKACSYAERVAQRAQSLYAPRAVIEHMTRAITASMKCDPECCPEAVPPHLYRMRGLAYEGLGEFELALTDHEAAIASAREMHDPRAEWQARIDLGMLWASRDYDRTGAELQQAHELAVAMGDERLIATTLNRIGNWRVNSDHPVEGVQDHQEALAIFQRLDDMRGTAESLDFLSMACGLSGDATAAFEHAAAGAELYRKLDDRQGLSGILATFGFYTHGAETLTLTPSPMRRSEMEEYSDEALRIAEEISWLPGQAFAHCQRAIAASSVGEYGSALTFAAKALEIATAIEHRQWQTFSHYNLGCFYTDLGARGPAIEHFDRACELALSNNSQHWIRITNADKARSLARWRQYDDAEAILAEHLPPDLPMISVAQRGMWLAKAEVLMGRGEMESALQVLDGLGTSAKNVGFLSLRAIPYLSMLRGKALLELGRPDDAAPDIDACLEASRGLGLRPLEWMALAALADLAHAGGHDDEARAHASQALEVVDELAATIDDAAVRHMYLISEPVEQLRQHAQAGAF
jgi:class 3 adenylate cyclase/tetratricopeptide (TPR) repeat protein